MRAIASKIVFADRLAAEASAAARQHSACIPPTAGIFRLRPCRADKHDTGQARGEVLREQMDAMPAAEGIDTAELEAGTRTGWRAKSAQ